MLLKYFFHYVLLQKYSVRFLWVYLATDFFLCYYYREILLTSQSTDWQTQENQKLIVHILNKDVSFVEAEIKFIWHAKIISESISFYLAQGRGSEIC